MATIDQVKKHYSKLTDRERFSLIHAAAHRNDDNELKELQRTAPRKHVSFPSTIGLVEGIQWAGTWYMLEQQSDLMVIFWMFHQYSDDPQPIDMNFEGHKIHADPEEIAGELIRRILARAAAWQDLCQDYKIDPAAELEARPRFGVMQMMIGILTAAAQEKRDMPSQDQVTAALESMRANVDHFVKDWE